MAFIEPTDIMHPSTKTTKTVAKKTGQAKTGVTPVKKEKKKMAAKKKFVIKKSIGKKPRTAAQKAATARMLLANKRNKAATATTTTAKPKKRRGRKPVRKTAKPVDIRESSVGGSSVTLRGNRKATPRAKTFAKRVSKQVASSRGKKRTTTYRVSPKGRASKTVRQNPVMQTKQIVSMAVGFGLGIVGADILDRFVATRKGKDNTAPTGSAAKAKIEAKADGIRIFAQAAGIGLSALGAYALRKKSPVGTYMLAGVAAGFAANGLKMILVDHLLPKVLKSDKGVQGRLAYGTVSGPMGYLRPFQGKPTVIGPQATGSVGGCGCTRSPVDPSNYNRDERSHCKPWPFQRTNIQNCIDTVNQRPPIEREVPRTPPQVQVPPVFRPESQGVTLPPPQMYEPESQGVTLPPPKMYEQESQAVPVPPQGYAPGISFTPSVGPGISVTPGITFTPSMAAEHKEQPATCPSGYVMNTSGECIYTGQVKGPRRVGGRVGRYPGR